VLGTILGALAQVFGVPTAGARELNYLFPLSILSGVAVWWLTRTLARRGRIAGRVAAPIVLITTLGAFAVLFSVQRSNDHPWFDIAGIEQAQVAAQYLSTIEAGRPVVFTLDPGILGSRPAWPVVRTGLGAFQAKRAYLYWGSPQDYLAGVRTKPNGGRQPTPEYALPSGVGDPVAIVLQRYNPSGYRALVAQHPERVVGPGVAIVRGPLSLQPYGVVRGQVPHVSPRTIVITSTLIVALLLVTGGGWAIALLPADAAIRVCLAPALACGVLVVGALAWDVLGLPLSTEGVVVLIALLTSAGWALAIAQRGRALRAGST
jgi:hypothetical protein